MNVRSIHHFEDEPEFIKWIPGALLNLYWRLHPEWIVDQANFQEEDEHLTSFELKVNGTPWKIQYRFYTDVAEFKAKFEASDKDVALIDLMNAGQFPGLEVYEMASEALGQPSVYFLTAFPGEVQTRNPLPAEFVLSKPVDVAELVALLVRKLDVQ